MERSLARKIYMGIVDRKGWRRDKMVLLVHVAVVRRHQSDRGGGSSGCAGGAGRASSLIRGRHVGIIEDIDTM